jgi:CheY-like chemotaxis protein
MRRQIKVLMVEDRVEDAEMLLREMRGKGLEVLSKRVDTSNEFEFELGDFAPDLILSDYTLPGFDGIEAPLDALKIDRSFVAGMAVSVEHMAIVSAIINLARAPRIHVVAEGVETEEQAARLPHSAATKLRDTCSAIRCPRPTSSRYCPKRIDRSPFR